MITYGITMENKSRSVPKELATWIIERNALYPKIEFRIDSWEQPLEDTSGFETVARKYSRIYHGGNLKGFRQVSFLYLSQTWNVRTIGGVSRKDGSILDLDNSDTDNIISLPTTLANEVIGLPDQSLLERLGDETVGLVRKEDEPVQNDPEEFVTLDSDLEQAQ